MSFDEEMREERQVRRNHVKAREMVLEALKLARGDFYVQLPAQELTSGTCHTFTRQQIGNGTVAFVLGCNMSGGSVGDIHLYDLHDAYFRNLEFRNQANDLLRQLRQQTRTLGTGA